MTHIIVELSSTLHSLYMLFHVLLCLVVSCLDRK